MTFRDWHKAFDDRIEVCPVELPGRGTRFAESPREDLPSLCAQLRADIGELLDGVPVALFGHSMGARVAFELALALGGTVIHLFVSAAPAPDTQCDKAIGDLSDRQVIARLRDMGGTPPAVLANEELMAIVLPVLRADMRVVERYAASSQARAPCAVTVFAGREDKEVNVGDAARWSNFALGGMRMVDVPGGHFFLDSQRALVLSEVSIDLQAAIERMPPREA